MRDDLRGAEYAVVERGMRVRHQGDRIAERERAAHRRVHAKVGLHAADDQTIDPACLQLRLQIGLMKSVGARLAKTQIGGAHLERGRQLPTGRVVQHRAFGFFVLHHHDRQPGRTGARRHRIDSLHDRIGFMHGPAAFAQNGLHIDDEQG